jgi:hypothetical protein
VITIKDIDAPNGLCAVRYAKKRHGQRPVLRLCLRDHHGSPSTPAYPPNVDVNCTKRLRVAGR